MPINTSPSDKSLRDLPCSVCKRRAGRKSKALQCDYCKAWVHVSCDSSIPVALYSVLQLSPDNPLIYPCPDCRKPSTSGASGTTRYPPSANDVSEQDPELRSTNSRVRVANGKQTKHRLTGQTNPTPPASRSSPNVKRSTPSLTSDCLKQSTGASAVRAPSAIELVGSPATPVKKHITLTTCPVGKAKPSRSSLIVLNWPESTSNSLAQRDQDEASKWASLCDLLQVNSQGLRRITRLSSPLSDLPRPVRITLDSADDVERIIVMSVLYKERLGGVKVLPDLPWAERQARRIARLADPSANLSRPRSVVLHGVPELAEGDARCKLAHDFNQWQYIKSKVASTADIGACAVSRLPRPAHLSWLPSPRLLRVTLPTEQMAQELVDLWEASPQCRPQGIRLHHDRPRSVRLRDRKQPIGMQPQVVLHKLTESRTPLPATLKPVPSPSSPKQKND